MTFSFFIQPENHLTTPSDVSMADNADNFDANQMRQMPPNDAYDSLPWAADLKDAHIVRKLVARTKRAHDSWVSTMANAIDLNAVKGFFYSWYADHIYQSTDDFVAKDVEDDFWCALAVSECPVIGMTTPHIFLCLTTRYNC